VTGRYLIDKSALARMQHAPVAERVGRILAEGLALTCPIIDLEVLYSARNAQEHVRIRRRRRLAYESAPLSESIFERAIEVQGLLSVTGKHRVPIPDLLIAATAERAEAIVLHYDSDFEVIASVTGQHVEWVVRRGSVP
jgi:predicted nucleic acid-binding protein